MARAARAIPGRAFPRLLLARTIPDSAFSMLMPAHALTAAPARFRIERRRWPLLAPAVRCAVFTQARAAAHAGRGPPAIPPRLKLS